MQIGIGKEQKQVKQESRESIDLPNIKVNEPKIARDLQVEAGYQWQRQE